MLFTKSTEAGIKLENALLLTPELIEKAQIPANNSRISEWARDNHVNVAFDVSGQSDFNCRLGIMMDMEVSDSTYNANKKMLKHLGDELTKFIENMSSDTDEATDDAIAINELKKLIEEFHKNVGALNIEGLVVHIEVYKLTAHEFPG